MIRPLELKLDHSEIVLYEAIKAGDLRAAMYVLRTQGHDRGYGR